jgi:hypothetical protein
MPYPTVYEPIATNKNDVTVQAGDHPDHHNTVARILNSVQQQLLGTVGGAVSFGPGTAALPSISFAADPNTGLYNSAADQVGIATAGLLRWYVDANGHWLAGTDNSVDIGAPATRPRNLYAGTQVLAANGSAAAPSYSFSVATNLGIFERSGVAMTFAVSGQNVFDLQAGFLVFRDTPYLGWASGDPALNVADVRLFRDAAAALALRNGTNAQTLNVYGTYTDAANYSRAQIGGFGGNAAFLSNVAGTGSSAPHLYVGTIGSGTLQFRTNNADRWAIQAGGTIIANTDNSLDIGAVGANRPRTIYAGTSVVAGTSVLTPLLDTIGVHLNLAAAGVGYWLVRGTPFTGYTLGSLEPIADNTVDIGGASGGTNRRPRNILAAGALATGGKPGIPVDADVSQPFDGMLRLDTTNHRLYVRDGGVWRYAALT